MKTKFLGLILMLASLWLNPLPAQQLPDHTGYARAVELFQSGHRIAARENFEKLRLNPANASLLPDIDYYLTVIRLENDADPTAAIENYLVYYPSSPYRQKLMLRAADTYFAQGQLRRVREIIDNMAVYDLSKPERRRVDFYLAYIALKDNDLKKAKRYFKKLEDDPHYGNQAKYYLGYIAYLKNNPAEASRYFRQVSGDKQYGRNIPYYNADMYYRTGQFQKAIDEALKIYDHSRGKQRNQLAKIIGSSYFNLHQYDKAIPYLKAYKGQKGRLSNKDLYELGYAYFQAGRCDRAVEYFNKIIGSESPLAQNAYYHLAKCYLKNDEKAKALNALKKVSEMPFDKDLQEDALYQYIKLGYEIGNPYEPIGDAVTRYKEKYPASPRIKELDELLLNSYLSSHRFDNAITAMRRAGMTARPEYQKATFYRGLELFNDGQYEEALRMFDVSLRQGKDLNYRNKALFWKAETLFRLGRLQDALLAYRQFEVDNNDNGSFEAKMLPYNLGYVYFKMKNYDKAAAYFGRFVRHTTDDRLLKDAYLRLGDSYFAAKKYWPAMEAYNQAITRHGADADYAFYQKAVSYGFVARDDRKIEELNKFLEKFPKSPLRDDALYQLGSTYLNTHQPEKARAAFDRLLSEYPKSPYTAVALLKAGLAMYNNNQTEKAKDYFKRLIRSHPQTAEAHEAAQYLKNIYIDQNDADGYLAFIRSVKDFHAENTNLEKDIFDAAEEKYFFKNYPRARAALETYLKRFPDGIYRVKAHAYLAKIYQSQGETDKAYRHYAWLAREGSNAYVSEALRYLIAADLKAKRYDKAAGWLRLLEQNAQTDDDRYLAQTKLMYIYDLQQKADLAAGYAAKVLQNPKATAKQKQKAKLLLARQAVARGDTARAEQLYNELAEEAKGKTAAEALYYKALFLHQKGQYDASNKTITRLTKKYPSYKHLGGKALIVMARNMYAKGDVFNATYILENLIKRFKQYPDITAESQKLLDRIRSEQSQKNSDVQPENQQ